MSQAVAGSFASTGVAALGQISPELVIPSSTVTARLTTVGLDASNTVKTQKTTNNGASWVDQTTYNADQTNLGITVAHGEQWRLVLVAQQAFKTILYKLSAES